MAKKRKEKTSERNSLLSKEQEKKSNETKAKKIVSEKKAKSKK